MTDSLKATPRKLDETYRFPCATDDDGTPFFLHSKRQRLAVKGKRYTFPTPDKRTYWQEIKCGDSITEFDEDEDLIAHFEVCAITKDYVIATCNYVDEDDSDD